MINIQKILHDNFEGLKDAMNGDEDLAHFYKSLVGVCMQQFTLDVLEELKKDSSQIETIIDKIESQEWS